jgi:hypothetical protein
MVPGRGHWCEFCQMFHSSVSCYHPANRVANARIAELEAECKKLYENYAHWEGRATRAEAELAALKWKLQFCIDHDVRYVKADPLETVEEFLERRWAKRGTG